MVFDFFFFVLTVWVLPVLINKSTEGGRFDWVHPYLRVVWTIIFLLYTWYLLRQPIAQEVLVWLHNKDSIWTYILVGFIGAALLVGYYWLAGRIFETTQLSTKSEKSSPGNIETNITNWASGFGYSPRKEEKLPQENFRLSVGAPEAPEVSVPPIEVLIIQQKKHEGFVQFASQMDLHETMQKIFDSLPEKGRKALFLDLKLDLVKLKVQYSFKTKPFGLSYSIHVPVEGLTEGKFLEALTIMEAAHVIVTERIIQHLVN